MRTSAASDAAATVSRRNVGGCCGLIAGTEPSLAKNRSGDRGAGCISESHGNTREGYCK